MQIRIRVQNGSLHVAAAGHLSDEAAAELLDQVRLELAPRPRDVVLDLDAVESISAGALAYIFRIRHEAEARASRFVLAGRSSPVQRLLERTGVLASLAPAGDAVAIASGSP
jgi:anti-anti-sigma factor